MALNTEIIKEAGVLRKRLEKGSININELNSFLTRVENINPPPAGKKSNNRFNNQLINLDKGHSKKAIA